MRYLRRPHFVRSGVLALVGVLALGAAPAASAETGRDGRDRKGPAPAADTIRIATFNTAAMSSPAQGFSDVKNLLAQGPDIVALQEMSSWKRREKVRKQLLDCATCAWDGWMPVPAVQGGQPILWRSDKFTFLGRDWIELAPETFVGSRGAGPSTMHAKYVVRVRLLDNLTGRTIWILNNHFVPTVQSSKGGRNDLRRRTQLYERTMTSLQSVIDQVRTKEGGGLIFVTGDFNVNYRKDKTVQDPIFPYAALGTRRLSASYSKLGEPATGTHVLGNGFDKRLIDYVLYRPSWRAIATKQRIVRGMHSDHRPLMVDFKINGKGCWVHGKVIC